MFQRRKQIAIVLASLLAIAGILLIGAILFLPPTVRDHNEGIAWVLKQRNIRYTSLDAKLPWPEGLNYYMYGPEVYPYQLNVKIVTPENRTVSGFMRCTQGMKGCTLDIPEFGVIGVATPNVRDGSEWPWLRWLERLRE